MHMNKLSASILKDILWNALNGVRAGSLPTDEANAIATQSREILRIVNAQLRIADHSQRAIPDDIISFSEDAVDKPQ